MTPKRCTWVSMDDPLMLQYHDREWGVPVHDDRKHFEFLLLEGAQAGLSWSIVLKKREGYRRAFSEFDPEKVARYTEKQIQKLTLDPAIIRNRMKIEAAVRNARAFLAVQEEFGSFDAYCWRFVNGRPTSIDGTRCGRFQRPQSNPVFGERQGCIRARGSGSSRSTCIRQSSTACHGGSSCRPRYAAQCREKFESALGVPFS